MSTRSKRGKTSGTRDFEQRNTGGGRCTCGKIFYWHIGHPPSRLTAGRVSRSDLDEQRPT